MIHPTAFQPRRIAALALLCAMLGACSTMEKSSTGTGSLATEQKAAPVSEAAQTQAVKAPSAGTQALSPAPPSNAAAAPAPTTAQPEAPTGTTAAAPLSSPEIGAANQETEDVDIMKRRLADEEARINKLHDEQEMAKQQAEEEAAKQHAQEATAPAPEQAAPPATAAPAAAAPAAPVASATAVEPAATGETQPAVERPLQRSVYFDYDRATIKDDYDSMLVANAAYIKSHNVAKTEIQGNCDERGSREYNLALGARRAEAVKRALELAGADGRRIKTVSFGSEKPVASGQDEESYSQNRRADIVY